MSLFDILIFLIALGLVYYLITLLPLPEPFKKIILVVFILILIILLLQFAGIGGGPILRIR